MIRRTWGMIAILAVGLSCAAASAAERAPAVKTDNPLSQKITINVPGDQLSGILAVVKDQTGITLEAAPPMGDVVLILRFQGTVQELMDNLARFFAASKTANPRWARYGQDNPPRYRLERDIATQQMVDKLRNEREVFLRERLTLLSRCRNLGEADWQQWTQTNPTEAATMKEAVNQANRGTQVVWRLAALPIEQQQRILSGGAVVYRAADLAPEGVDPDQFIRDWLGKGNSDQPSKDSTVTFYSVGSGFNRGFFVRLDYGPARPGLSTTTGITASRLFPDLKLDDQSAKWLKQLGVEAKGSEEPIQLSGELDSCPLVREQLWRIAEQAKCNLIAEDYGWRYYGPPITGRLSLKEMMERFCYPPAVTGTRDSGSYFWWKSKGEVYMLRSLNWPEDEPLAISYKAVQSWKAFRKRSGILGIDQLAEMAALNRDTFRLLSLWFPEAEFLQTVQTPLRWYAQAPAAIRQQARSQIGANLVDLGLDRRRALQSQDPTDEKEIVWKWMLEKYSPETIRLSVLNGSRKQPDGTVQIGVGIIFHHPDNYDSPDHKQVMVIPLFPEK